jgi:hypothetical protein
VVIVALLLAARGPRRGAGDVAAGDGEEHVVEVRGVDRQPLDGDTGLVQLVEQLTERVDGAVCRDLQDQLVLVRSSRREQPGRRAQQVGTGEVESDVPAGDPALQLGRGSFGDDPALVEHRDPVGQLVRLVEVLGGEQMVTPAEASSRMISHMVRRLRGSKPVVGSSRKITRGSTRVIARSSRRRIPPE